MHSQLPLVRGLSRTICIFLRYMTRPCSSRRYYLTPACSPAETSEHRGELTRTPKLADQTFSIVSSFVQIPVFSDRDNHI